LTNTNNAVKVHKNQQRTGEKKMKKTIALFVVSILLNIISIGMTVNMMYTKETVESEKSVSTHDIKKALAISECSAVYGDMSAMETMLFKKQSEGFELSMETDPLTESERKLMNDLRDERHENIRNCAELMNF
jgi:ABC-type protease/lipase transport system fused ATPase/permease subunit